MPRQYSPQSIFLFRWPTDLEKGIFERLRQEPHVHSVLKKRGLEDVFNANKSLGKLQDHVPVLASVWYENGPPRRLLFKWVEKRIWGKFIRGARGGRIQLVPEKADNFFCLNVENGDSKILIQRLQPNPQMRLWEELALYKDCVRELLGFDFNRLLPFPLYPAIQAVFHDSHCSVKEYGMVDSKGNVVNVAGNPILPREGFVLRFVEFDMTLPPGLGGPFRVIIDGHKKNYVGIEHITSLVQHNAILDRVRTLGEYEIQDADVKQVAETIPNLQPILAKIDIHLAQKNTVLDGQHLAKAGWNRDEILAAFEALSKQNDLRFQLAYYVYDPIAKERMKNEVFRDKTKIPPALLVSHNNKPAMLKTADNTWIVLHVIDILWGKGVTRTLLRRASKSKPLTNTKAQLIELRTILAIAMGSLVGFLLTLWFLLYLADAYSSLWYIIYPAGVLVLAVWYVLFQKLLGAKDMHEAVELILGIIKALKRGKDAKKQ
jgi:hypothetical protein